MIFKKKQDAAAQQAAAGEARPAGKDKVAAFFRKNWKWMVPVVCVAVLGGYADPEEMRRSGADYVIDDIGCVRDIFEGGDTYGD